MKRKHNQARPGTFCITLCKLFGRRRRVTHWEQSWLHALELLSSACGSGRAHGHRHCLCAEAVVTCGCLDLANESCEAQPAANRKETCLNYVLWCGASSCPSTLKERRGVVDCGCLDLQTNHVRPNMLQTLNDTCVMYAFGCGRNTWPSTLRLPQRPSDLSGTPLI